MNRITNDAVCDGALAPQAATENVSSTTAGNIIGHVIIDEPLISKKFNWSKFPTSSAFRAPSLNGEGKRNESLMGQWV